MTGDSKCRVCEGCYFYSLRIYLYLPSPQAPEQEGSVEGAVSELVWALESGVGELDWADIGLGTQPPDPQVASVIRVS